MRKMAKKSVWRGLLILVCSVSAQAEVDRGFGQDGHVTLGFQPRGTAPGADQDVASVACAGPNGSLVVMGIASGERRIVTAWLTESGELDTNFSVDGKETFDVPGGLSASALLGACLPGGKLLLAYEHYDGTPAGDGNIHVVRIDPALGLPDPTFASGGTLVLDLDQHASGLGPLERPRAINLSANGDLLITGVYSPDASTDTPHLAGFLARISAGGSLRRLALSHRFAPEVRKFGAAGVAADGSIWVAARYWPEGGSIDTHILRLDGETLESLDTPIPPVVDLDVDHGYLHEGREFLLAGSNMASRPVVAAARVGGSQRLDLPLPPNNNGVTGVQIALLPDGDLLYLGRTSEGSRLSGSYLARVSRGSSGLRRVASYGAGGALMITLPSPSACPTAVITQYSRRFTYWRGRPTLVGAIDRSCDTSDQDMDYFALRLQPPAFGDGFE